MGLKALQVLSHWISLSIIWGIVYCRRLSFWVNLLYNNLYYPISNSETPTKILSFLQTNSNEAESNNRFFKFIERDQCDSLKVKRIPLIHRGTKASVDPKVMKFIFYGIFFCDYLVWGMYGSKLIHHFWSGRSSL